MKVNDLQRWTLQVKLRYFVLTGTHQLHALGGLNSHSMLIMPIFGLKLRTLEHMIYNVISSIGQVFINRKV